MLEKYNRDTKDWIRTKADERAAAAGMIFDGERGEHVCTWIEKNCYLWEGAMAGRPIKLIPYQREFVMRLFSWVQKATEGMWRGEWVRRFTTANLLAAKKNGKTPFLAALELYAAFADGEMGNRVYTSAKTGKQAQLPHGKAVQMWESSPNLKDRCTLNKATLTIYDPKTKSKLMILAGDDTRGAQANEGINGSIFIDELHVYDREMARRTSRAGISRKEPLNVAVSTAGDDPSSYGYTRVEYGNQVNDGTRTDHHVLHVEYSVPDKVTDAEIDADFERYAKQANPAYGYIVRSSEIRNDYDTCKDSPRDLAAFKQYRLNMWIGSVSPWLSTAIWEKGKRDYKPDIFNGMSTKVGLDLSRTRDMTSAVFGFEYPHETPDGDLIRIWPMFWLPEETARKRRNLFDYMGWSERGHLKLIPGAVMSFNKVEDDICEFIEEHELECEGIFFDQTYAEDVTQRLMDRLGCERTAVSQRMMTVTTLAKEVERRIEKGAILHPGNEVFDWQVGHVQVERDRNDNIAPKKPDPLSGKSIDGIAALIDMMAGIYGEMGLDDDGPSVSFL